MTTTPSHVRALALAVAGVVGGMLLFLVGSAVLLLSLAYSVDDPEGSLEQSTLERITVVFTVGLAGLATLGSALGAWLAARTKATPAAGVLALGAAGPLLTAVMIVAAGGGVDAEVIRTLAAVAIASLVGAGLVTWQIQSAGRSPAGDEPPAQPPRGCWGRGAPVSRACGARIGLLSMGAMVVGGACSGAGDDESRPSKPDYVAQANAVCRQAGEDVSALADQLLFVDPDAPPTPEQRAEYARRSGQIVRARTAELRALPPPEGDEAVVAAIYQAFETVIDDGEAGELHPAEVERASRLAGDYGLADCTDGAGPGSR